MNPFSAVNDDDKVIQKLLSLSGIQTEDENEEAGILEKLFSSTDNDTKVENRRKSPMCETSADDDIGILQELLNSSSNFDDNDSDTGENFNTVNTPSNSASQRQIHCAASSTSILGESSSIHQGDTDSSDDEDRRCFEEEKYNSCGKTLKKLLKENDATSSRFQSGSFSTSWKASKNELAAPKPLADADLMGIGVDPLFGIRIINPLMSSIILKERMNGRQVIPMDRVKAFVVKGPPKDSDWIVGGVVVMKSDVKVSQKGKQYVLWRLSDLKCGLKSITVFLFGSCFKQHWKISLGTVVAILNPKIMDNSDGKGIEATFSVDNSLKVLIIGTSKDFGYCKAKKKNGGDCTSFVNKRDCEYCAYHIVQGHKAYSQFARLRPSSEGGGGLVNLRNKVLGKNEVFYGGQSFTAVPAPKSKRLTEKDTKTLRRLSDFGIEPKLQASSVLNNRGNSLVAACNNSPSNQNFRNKDAERLKLLSGSNTQAETSSSTETVTQNSRIRNDSVIGGGSSSSLSLKSKENKFITQTLFTLPQLGSGLSNSDRVTFTSGRQDRLKAKLNALAYIQKNGPLKKGNQTKKASDILSKKFPEFKKPSEIMKKRVPDSLENKATKRCKQDAETPVDVMKSSRFQELMNATSSHKDLLEANDLQAEDEYFDKLEKKEKLEEKMLTTFKVPCKAVVCSKCKYTSFSALDSCKADGHHLKVIDAVKRFYKCEDCGNRTVTLNLIPEYSCKKCSGSRWMRAPMIREKKDGLTSTLSIRGDEEKFIGSLQSGGNLNLLVSDE